MKYAFEIVDRDGMLIQTIAAKATEPNSVKVEKKALEEAIDESFEIRLLTFSTKVYDWLCKERI